MKKLYSVNQRSLEVETYILICDKLFFECEYKGNCYREDYVAWVRQPALPEIIYPERWMACDQADDLKGDFKKVES